MLTDAQRSLYYAALGASPAAIREVEEMRLTSPSRQVSQRGLKNVLVDMRSGCNAGRRTLESVSCEFIYALELDTFGGCHEYYTQVSPKNVVRYGKTSSAHVDFLVFRKNQLALVECKPRSSLEALQIKRPDEWQCRDGVWHRPVLEAWAQDRGLVYEIWSPPEPHGIYGANLLAVHAAKESDPTFAEAACVARLCRLLHGRALTLRDALDEVVGLTAAHVFCALATGQAYGLLKSVSVDQTDQFVLFGDRAQSEECDERLLAALKRGGEQPSSTSGLISATPVDYANGKLRLARVERMIEGSEPTTRRYSVLVRDVRDAKQAGENPLEVCLTHFVNSGRRVGQLTGDQEFELDRVIARFRRDPLIRTKLQAHDHLVLACRSRGIRAPCRTTLHSRLQRCSRERRAHAVGGYRGFHALEEAIDPMDRTLRCPVPGLMVHVDSTKLDARCSPSLIDGLEFDCPTLYVAVDSATGMPLGFTVLFGPSCRLALAVLIRDILYRQDFLPCYWVADHGAEYMGPWFEGYCDYTGATRIQPPPGAPRKNSLAENALGRINAEVAHRFLGSTDPDKAGRSVTAKQKSYHTACHDYSTIVAEIERYLFTDLPSTPLPASRTCPADEWEQRVATVGHAGVFRVINMDDFLISTSVPLDRSVKIDPVRGIRYLQRKYVSSDLLLLGRTERPVEIRIDCVDPHRIYVKFRSRWVLAQTAQSLKRGNSSTVTKLFEGAVDEARRGQAARSRAAIRQDRILRIEQANQAAAATKHLESQLKKEEGGVQRAAEVEEERVCANWGDPDAPILPFATDGEEES